MKYWLSPTMIKSKKFALGIACYILSLFVALGTLTHCSPLFEPKDDSRLSILMPKDRPLKIAQFADLHFGDGESNYHNTQEERTKSYMSYIVDNGKPDLIVCTGDQVMSVGVEGTKEFVALMDSYKTPWVFVWGNHDAEGYSKGYYKYEVSSALANSNSQYLLYDEGYIERGKENRYGNFSISVLDADGKNTIGALIFLDSGTYSYKDEAYQEITSGQVDWYRQEIDELQQIYKSQSPTSNAVIPSIVFAHMPLPDFSVAHRKAEEEDGAQFVIKDGRFLGERSEKSDYSPLFNAMVEKGSTKAYLVGHYHVAKSQVKMDGIILGFGPQTGFSHAGHDGPRSTYIYSVDKDFSILTQCIVEQNVV